MTRSANDIRDNINTLRTELGMDVRSYPGTSRTALLVIEQRFVTLKKDWANDSRADNICGMHFTDIARAYNLHEIDAKAFYENIVMRGRL